MVVTIGFNKRYPCCCRARDKGLRTAALIRFIGKEDGLLSHTHDGPRMFINLEGMALEGSARVVAAGLQAASAGHG